jgi:hypothetical protein
MSVRWGLIVYEMLTGQRAISGQKIFDVLRHDQLDAQRLAAPLLEPFRQILVQSLAHDPHQRSLTMADIAASLA